MYGRFLKRGMDFVLSLLALIVLSPLLLLLTVIGAVAMRGNPFFTQLRPGRIDKRTGKEKIFRLVKFRTMTNAKDKNGDLLPDAQRLSKYGAWLRSTSLDELPELWNILKGDMSVVGPRPLLVEYLPYYTDEERHRHDVRPGLTGLAQVNGRNSVSWEKRFQFDLEYTKSISALNDAKIVILTIRKVLSRNGVAENTNEIEGNFAQIRRKEGKMRIEEKSEI